MADKTINEIPLLTAQDVECRVQSIIEGQSGKIGAVLLLYKDARVDMRVLDQVYGSGNWQRTHEVINGNLFCNIDIWDYEKQCWIRKQDVGVESNTEKEKGQASDSFKRAGFNVGIGRELYTSPFIYVELNDKEYYTDKKGQNTVYKCRTTTRFTVTHIAYNDRREISELTIKDRYNKVRYTYPRTEIPQEPPTTPAHNNKADTSYNSSSCGNFCSDCNDDIGNDVYNYSVKVYGLPLCRKCQKAHPKL